jgi:hypothetical protein
LDYKFDIVVLSLKVLGILQRVRMTSKLNDEEDFVVDLGERMRKRRLKRVRKYDVVFRCQQFKI